MRCHALSSPAAGGEQTKHCRVPPPSQKRSSCLKSENFVNLTNEVARIKYFKWQFRGRKGP